MYTPPHFAETREDVSLAMLRAAGFGHLVVVTDEGLDATPIPFVVDDELTTVRTHVARPNPVWRLAPCDALLIVPVTDAYISPSWYPSKKEHGKVVPTWNYEVMHVHGRLVARDDADWILRQITDLTEVNESRLPTPWAVSDAPADFIATTQRGIVGIEMTIDRIAAKRKVSQNRSEADIDGVLHGLAERGDGRSRSVIDGMQR
jgi:transcriptional regulator